MNFVLLDLVGHLGYAAMFFGLFLIARGQKIPKFATIGWPLRLAGEATWVAIGVCLMDAGIGMSSIVVWGIAFMVVDLVGFWHATARETK